MNKILPDDWSYDRVMLQLLETAGTVGEMKLYYNTALQKHGYLA